MTSTRSDIIRRFLNVESYTPEDLGFAVFTKDGEFNHTPVVLVGIDTVSDIINFLAEDNAAERELNETKAELVASVKIKAWPEGEVDRQSGAFADQEILDTMKNWK
jgi:hypothetical protein